MPERLGARELAALDDMDAAAVAWLEARASGSDTVAAAERIEVARVELRRAERARRRARRST